MNSSPDVVSQQYVSPGGSLITGTLERLAGRADLSGIFPSGEPDYDGSTEVFWDDQRTVLRDGKMVFLDDNGNEWTFDQLVPESEWKEPPLTADQLRDKFDTKDGWGEHPDHPMSAWRQEVENGDCRSGYWDWVVSQIEQAAQPA